MRGYSDALDRDPPLIVMWVAYLRVTVETRQMRGPVGGTDWLRRGRRALGRREGAVWTLLLAVLDGSTGEAATASVWGFPVGGLDEPRALLLLLPVLGRRLLLRRLGMPLRGRLLELRLWGSGRGGGSRRRWSRSAGGRGGGRRPGYTDEATLVVCIQQPLHYVERTQLVLNLLRSLVRPSHLQQRNERVTPSDIYPTWGANTNTLAQL